MAQSIDPARFDLELVHTMKSPISQLDSVERVEEQTGPFLVMKDSEGNVELLNLETKAITPYRKASNQFYSDQGATIDNINHHKITNRFCFDKS